MSSPLEQKLKETSNLPKMSGWMGSSSGICPATKKLVLGKDGRIEGNVKAKEAVIMGTIVGDIQILGLLHLDRTAVIKGNIQTAALSIEEGASFDGACKVGK